MAKNAITIVDGLKVHHSGILQIIDQLPQYFLPIVKNDISELLLSCPSLVALDQNKIIVGFLIWEARFTETELLWMAVVPSLRGQSVGSALLDSCLKSIDMAKPVFLRTATTDSEIPGTSFDGNAYQVTQDFFYSRGFTVLEKILGYWGPKNHCLIMRYAK